MTGEHYHRNARRFFDEYEAIAFEQAHARVLDFLPHEPGLVLDVGAGSGRDAAWFAARGHEVVAVEPADGLREAAGSHHVSPRIRWVDDQMPSLQRIAASGATFDLVWVSAVWMHLPVGVRPRAFRKLANLLRPGGRLFISLRHGPFDDDRQAWPVSAPDLLDLARRHGLVCSVHHGAQPDGRGRQGVSWETLIFELPDDGTGAFPRLRSIILNDDRSSTYKLGLLRALLRIADGCPGLIESDENGDAVVPLGLVALFWIRLYKPLVAHGFRQAPGHSGYGFASPDFEALALSPSLLKPGVAVHGTDATYLHGALRQAARHIRNMPARFITDTAGAPVFRAQYRNQRKRTPMRLDAPTLGSFGELSVPADLWRTMRRHTIWIEPVIENEWIRSMRTYDEGIGRRQSADEYRAGLAWLSPEHDTREGRTLVEELRSEGQRVTCTWRNTALRESYAIDHVMPWIRWPCNDLWNLVPASPAANSSKGDRLPSAPALERAEEHLHRWWTWIRLKNEDRGERFEQEVRATLPFVRQPSNASELFDGVSLLRASLRRDQQIPEWPG